MNTFSSILQTIRTKEDLDMLNQEIDILKRSAFTTKPQALENALASSVREPVARAIRELFSTQKLDAKTLFESLKKELEKFRVLSLTIAFEPTEKTLDRFNAWVIEHMGEHWALDITCDSNVLGGAVVVVEGKYFDGSVRKVYEEITQISNKPILNKL